MNLFSTIKFLFYYIDGRLITERLSLENRRKTIWYVFQTWSDLRETFGYAKLNSQSIGFVTILLS